MPAFQQSSLPVLSGLEHTNIDASDHQESKSRLLHIHVAHREHIDKHDHAPNLSLAWLEHCEGGQVLPDSYLA